MRIGVAGHALGLQTDVAVLGVLALRQARRLRFAKLDLVAIDALRGTVLSGQGPAGFRVVESIRAALLEVRQRGIAAGVLHVTGTAALVLPPSVQATTLGREPRDLLVAGQAPLVQVLFAPPMALETAQGGVEVLVGTGQRAR